MDVEKHYFSVSGFCRAASPRKALKLEKLKLMLFKDLREPCTCVVKYFPNHKVLTMPASQHCFAYNVNYMSTIFAYTLHGKRTSTQPCFCPQFSFIFKEFKFFHLRLKLEQNCQPSNCLRAINQEQFAIYTILQYF
jgi:hypothetical protein